MLLFIYCLLLMFLYLICPDELIILGKDSLIIWYNAILPSLFPSMIIAGILMPCLISLKFPGSLAKKAARLFGISEKGLIAVIPGFLCGFPMGSYLCKELIKQEVISLKEAQRILSFSNNIGPIYFLAVISKDLNLSLKLSTLLLFYCIPILYALLTNFLSHMLNRMNHTYNIKNRGKALQPLPCRLPVKEKPDSFSILDQSINNAVSSILRLCAYIFAARTLLIIPVLIKKYIPDFPDATMILMNALIEITSGIEQMSHLTMSANKLVLIEIPFLVFGGICSIAQTACMIRGSRLSLKKYIYHKCIQGILAFSVCLPLFYFT